VATAERLKVQCEVRWRHSVGCQVRRHGAAKVVTLGEEAARKFEAGEALSKADVKM